MTSSFQPPVGVAALARVDVATVEYGDGCAVIQGVVSPRGECAWPDKSGRFDVHCLGFAAWRIEGGPLVTGQLTLLRPVPPERAGQPRAVDIFKELPTYSVQRLSVLLSKDKDRAVVEKVLPNDAPDGELAAFAEEARKEIRITAGDFGELVLNPLLGWFEGRRPWLGAIIQVTFETDKDGGISNALRTAERLWADQADWQRRAEELAVAEFLQQKNDDWLYDDEEELSAEQFVAQMRLTAIDVAEDGLFTFWFDDGCLFGGHGIEVFGDVEGGLTSADNHI